MTGDARRPPGRAGRLTLLITSPRVAAGMLTREAWQALEGADVVLGRDDDPQVLAVREAGIEVRAPEEDAPALLGRALVARARAGEDVVWVGSADGDPGLTDVVATEMSTAASTRVGHQPGTDSTGAPGPAVEVVLGSHDVPGSRLLDLVAVMDRLRSPGGCPWDRQQTHASLVPYLVEEAYEAAEALESGDRQHMVDELGDVLLQVVFHARVAEEDEAQPFDVDDVAAAIVAKLVRRHPHVFADGDASTAGEVALSWEQIKAAERAASGDDREDPLHGVPQSLPSLPRATKVVSRLRRAGLGDQVDEAAQGEDPGARLLALVAELAADGVDPDAALREAVRRLVERVGTGSR